MARRIKLEGAKELDRVLRRLPRKLGKRILTSASAAGGRVVSKEAKRLVPVNTGGLRDSIIVRRDPRRPGLVIVGPKYPEGAHGHLVEFGTAQGAAPHPFLRPAFDLKRVQALAKIGDSLGRAVERAAVALAGSFAKSGLASRRR